jgi:hypothetical protein
MSQAHIAASYKVFRSDGLKSIEAIWDFHIGDNNAAEALTIEHAPSPFLLLTAHCRAFF